MMEPLPKRRAPAALKPNRVDRMILSVAPTWGVRRLQARATAWSMQEAVRKYESASHSRRTKGWLTTSSGPSVTTGAAVVTLRNRARDLVENNPYAKRGVEAIATNTGGMRWKITAPTKALQKKLTEEFRKWSASTDMDADGIFSLEGMQRQVMRAVAQDGEVIARRRWRRPGDGLDIPIQVQLLEGDYLDESRDFDAPREGRRVVNGIEYDKIGRRTAYWMHKNHPGDRRIITPMGSQPVPASEVAHAYRVGRPGNNRGVSWFAQVMLRLRDLDEFEDAALFRQKLANAFTAFVHGASATEKVIQKDDAVEDMEPGAIQYLRAGEAVTLSDPPAAPGYEGFVRACLHAIAGGLEIPYSVLTGDLSATNFSSGRMGWIEFGRSIKVWQQEILVAQFLDRVFGWFLEAFELRHGMVTEGVTIRWTPPRREMIDPSKEVKPIKEAIRGGLTTWQEECIAQGRDPQDVLDDWEEMLKEVDKRGIVWDIDPRKRTAAGVNANAGGGGGDEEEETKKPKPEEDEEGEEVEKEDEQKEDEE